MEPHACLNARAAKAGKDPAEEHAMPSVPVPPVVLLGIRLSDADY